MKTSPHLSALCYLAALMTIAMAPFVQLTHYFVLLQLMSESESDSKSIGCHTNNGHCKHGVVPLEITILAFKSSPGAGVIAF